jgi:hypothetical protein
MMVNFLRHYVGGVHNGWQKTPHIAILHEVSATATSPPAPAWTSTYDSWSQVMKPVTLYFQGSGSLAASLATRTTTGQSSFSGPTPSQSGSWATPPRPDTSVSYTTPALTRDVDFFGPGSVNLWLSVDVIALVCTAVAHPAFPQGAQALAFPLAAFLIWRVSRGTSRSCSCSPSTRSRLRCS